MTPIAKHTKRLARYAIWTCLLLTTLLPCGGQTAAPVPAPLAAPKAKTPVYFVQITDTHFGRRANAARTAKAVEMINALPMKIACVIHTGDITSNRLMHKPTVDESLAVLKKLKAPLHILPGNHDVITRNRIATLEVYTKRVGKLLVEATYEGVAFVGVYTEPLADEFPLEGFDPLKQLDAALKRVKGAPAVVFHHTPCVADFYANRMHHGWPAEARARWTKLLNSHNVAAVLAGHFHRDEHHWLGKVPLYVSASIDGAWGRQASFRLYEYANGKLSYRTQYVE